MFFVILWIVGVGREVFESLILKPKNAFSRKWLGSCLFLYWIPVNNKLCYFMNKHIHYFVLVCDFNESNMNWGVVGGSFMFSFWRELLWNWNAYTLRCSQNVQRHELWFKPGRSKAEKPFVDLGLDTLSNITVRIDFLLPLWISNCLLCCHGEVSVFVVVRLLPSNLKWWLVL